MQQFPCPFCGLRDEREFTFASEAGKTRPDTTQQISAQDWAAYLYNRKNPKGETREVWIHTPCAEAFILKRDTLTMAVLGAEQLRKDTP